MPRKGMMRSWWRKWLSMRRPWGALDPLEKAGWVCLAAAVLLWAGSFAFFGSGAFERVAKGTSPEKMIAWVLLPMIVQAILPLVASMLALFGALRFKRRLRAARFALCSKCLYDLRGLRGESACPECGWAIPTKGAVRVWREKFPNRKRMRRRARGPWWKYGGVGLGE